MTVNSNHEPSTRGQDNVLSHYFDELLPGDEHCNDNHESQSETDSESVSETVNATKDQAHSTEAKQTQAAHKQPKAEVQIAHHPQPTTNVEPSNTLVADTDRHSTALLPIDDEPSSHSDHESASYQEHKQRLEKMLQQLTPVNAEPLLSARSTLANSPELTSPEVTSSEHIKSDDSDQPITTEVLEAETTSVQAKPLSSEWLDNGRPHWAQEVFDILLIDVNGLKLGLPLVALGHIEAIEEDLTPLFGQSKWFLGLQKTPFGNIKTIDTAEYVMPEKGTNASVKDYKFVVSISGMGWGLAVDSIDQPIAIDPENIRWRSNRSSRPWMAGTVKDHMCVLLDIPAMGDILQKEDQNHRNPTGE